MSRVAGLNHDFWPDPGDVLLLRFLLHSDPEEAVAAWHLWRPGWDPDSPTVEQYRLYPLMAERVAALVPDEPKLGMLQGVRIQSTIQTLLILDRLEDVLATLDSVGIGGVVLKGAALALSVYDHVGQRPFQDIDIFVDPRRHAEVVSALRERGWIQRGTDFVGNQAVMMDRAGLSIDLHRKHSSELVLAGRPTSAWDNIETVKARRPLRSGREIQILAPADALLHTIAHGTQGRRVVQLRWVPDAQRLIMSGDVDWERAVQLAGRFAVAPIVYDSLVFLRSTTGMSPPAEVLSRLKDGRIPSRMSRRGLAAFHDHPNTGGFLGELPLTVRREFRYSLDQPWLTALRTAPSFFCTVWGVKRPRELPLEIARRAWRLSHNRQHRGAAGVP